MARGGQHGKAGDDGILAAPRLVLAALFGAGLALAAWSVTLAQDRAAVEAETAAAAALAGARVADAFAQLDEALAGIAAGAEVAAAAPGSLARKLLLLGPEGTVLAAPEEPPAVPPPLLDAALAGESVALLGPFSDPRNGEAVLFRALARGSGEGRRVALAELSPRAIESMLAAPRHVHLALETATGLRIGGGPQETPEPGGALLRRPVAGAGLTVLARPASPGRAPTVGLPLAALIGAFAGAGALALVGRLAARDASPAPTARGRTGAADAGSARPEGPGSIRPSGAGVGASGPAGSPVPPPPPAGEGPPAPPPGEARAAARERGSAPDGCGPDPETRAPLTPPLPIGTAAERPASARSGRPLPSPPKTPSDGRLRALAIDDSPANLSVLRALLSATGIRLETRADALSGIAALREAAEAARPFDVVLMDVMMPGVDGYEATRRIRALPGPPGRVPVIAVTASAFPEDVAACLAAGMDAHVPKPVDRGALLRAIAAAVGGGPGAAGLAALRPSLLAELSERLAEIESGRASPVEAVHAIAGAANHLGATDLVEAARATLRALRAGDPEANDRLARLARLLAARFPELRTAPVAAA